MELRSVGLITRPERALGRSLLEVGGDPRPRGEGALLDSRGNHHRE